MEDMKIAIHCGIKWSFKCWWVRKKQGICAMIKLGFQGS